MNTQKEQTAKTRGRTFQKTIQLCRTSSLCSWSITVMNEGRGEEDENGRRGALNAGARSGAFILDMTGNHWRVLSSESNII